MISLHCKQTEFNISLVEQYTNVTCQPFWFAQLNLARYSANIAMPSLSVYDYISILVNCQPRSQGLRGVKNCMRSETQPYSTVLQYGCVALRMRFFSQNFGTIK